jgi:uncharacterized membrane protein
MNDSARELPRPSRFPVLAEVGPSAPFRWLARGARDLRAQPWPSLFYGLCFAAMGWALAALLHRSPGLMMALLGGFLLLGPFLAMGLYEVARQREAGRRCDLFESTVAWRRHGLNVAILGIALGALLALWARSAMMVIAFSFPYRMPEVGLLLAAIREGREWGFLAVWFAVGALFAALVFAFTVIALPLMLDRGTDAITAMLASLACVARNPGTLAIWAACIVLLVGVGFATALVGLVLTGPWLGLATWHAYRELVRETDR